MRTPLQVGDKVFFAPDGSHRYMRPGDYTVVKVGTKWAELDGREVRGAMRVHKTLLFVDGAGFSSPGRVYASREAWEESQKVQAGLAKLRRDMQYGWHTEPLVTRAELIEVRRLLHLEPDNNL